MAIFNSYVSLPEGNLQFEGSNHVPYTNKYMIPDLLTISCQIFWGLQHLGRD